MFLITSETEHLPALYIWLFVFFFPNFQVIFFLICPLYILDTNLPVWNLTFHFVYVIF